MEMPPLDPAIVARRSEIVAALRGIVPGEGVIDDDAGLAAEFAHSQPGPSAAQGIHDSLRDRHHPPFTWNVRPWNRPETAVMPAGNNDFLCRTTARTAPASRVTVPVVSAA